MREGTWNRMHERALVRCIKPITITAAFRYLAARVVIIFGIFMDSCSGLAPLFCI